MPKTRHDLGAYVFRKLVAEMEKRGEIGDLTFDKGKASPKRGRSSTEGPSSDAKKTDNS